VEKLLDAVAAVVFLVSPEKVQAIASRIRRTDASKAASPLSGVVSAPLAVEVVDQLIDAWRSTSVSAEELASMLLAAGHVFIKATNQQSTELVWTGPTTPFVSARRTEQALLQVINAAEQTLFITSFVAYDVSTIVKALNEAVDRGVVISMLLESSQDHGGSISFNAIGKMRTLVPAARLYAWRYKADPFTDGRVHAKVAVSDGRMCFITSANLTGHAMEKNMEAGVLISGGQIPLLLAEHLQSLVSTNVVS
jgi:cardiolipin synthase